ncbi:autophagy related kinase activator Atg17 [Spathaspora passalidarum NRRL Y-27907]|uniref:Autophagy-related protein 17 n=1 Tax=Spathaspora passalidarum (strain NRRL Y-27907 / 11-Y1) TaxID=619300 RepID=G3AEZ7_SPAPN|nr:autophagy related kinase activator Atg17 [Spathaspora passalidarum NRRL Y-27907]EGW34801.1 autophagy related kinase activator Atg17 [Spathaspora passalidarum NRRL Y-27907]
MTISQHEVLRWSTEAQHTLERAQKICTSAQASLHSTQNELSVHLPDIMDAVEFLYDALARQHETVLRITESLKRHVRTKVDSVFEEFGSVLDPAVEKLDGIISQLRSTTVPLFLLREKEEEEQEDGKSLADFIAMDSIALLKQNINIYKSNCGRLRKALLGNFEDILEYNMKMNKQFSQIKKRYENLVPLKVEIKSIQSKESTIGTVLRENQALENELVSILEMLTNHYDQCMKAVELISKGNTTGINLEVLQGDVRELPDVAKELNAVYEIILKNEERSQKYLHTETIEATITLLQQELQTYRTFKTTALPKFILLLSECENKLQISSIPSTAETPTRLYVQILEELTFHYTQFLHIYKTKYLSELYHEQYTYPRKFLKKLTELLNQDMYRIQLEETERRKQWTAKYGNFIPKEFNLELELPSIVQIITEGLENIQSGEAEFNEGKEKELLDLIKLTK